MKAVYYVTSSSEVSFSNETNMTCNNDVLNIKLVNYRYDYTNSTHYVNFNIYDGEHNFVSNRGLDFTDSDFVDFVDSYSYNFGDVLDGLNVVDHSKIYYTEYLGNYFTNLYSVPFEYSKLYNVFGRTNTTESITFTSGDFTQTVDVVDGFYSILITEGEYTVTIDENSVFDAYESVLTVPDTEIDRLDIFVDRKQVVNLSITVTETFDNMAVRVTNEFGYDRTESVETGDTVNFRVYTGEHTVELYSGDMLQVTDTVDVVDGVNNFTFGDSDVVDTVNKEYIVTLNGVSESDTVDIRILSVTEGVDYDVTERYDNEPISFTLPVLTEGDTSFNLQVIRIVGGRTDTILITQTVTLNADSDEEDLVNVIDYVTTLTLTLNMIGFNAYSESVNEFVVDVYNNTDGIEVYFSTTFDTTDVEDPTVIFDRIPRLSRLGIEGESYELFIEVSPISDSSPIEIIASETINVTNEDKTVDITYSVDGE